MQIQKARLRESAVADAVGRVRQDGLFDAFEFLGLEGRVEAFELEFVQFGGGEDAVFVCVAEFEDPFEGFAAHWFQDLAFRSRIRAYTHPPTHKHRERRRRRKRGGTYVVTRVVERGGGV